VIFMKHSVSLIAVIVVLLCCGCRREGPKQVTVDLLNRMTPVKDQGRSQTCWLYAMLAAIETEHIMRGDSVNLSVAWLEKCLDEEPHAPESRRGMGATALRLLGRYGVVAYDAMRTVDTPAPRWAFMFGVQYTPLEFAHSVCAPDEYVALTSQADKPYGQMVDVDAPDNWLHDRFFNLPMDTLLRRTESAVSRGHGVCWESSGHAMAIVGLAHDERGRRYFVMKNSWGSARPNGGLDYLSYGYFRKHTLAVEMTRDAFGAWTP